MFTVWNNEIDKSFEVVDTTSGEIIASFSEFSAAPHQAELMAYLLNSDMLEHTDGSCGYLQSFDGYPYGLIDLDCYGQFHNLWSSYEEGTL